MANTAGAFIRQLRLDFEKLIRLVIVFVLYGEGRLHVFNIFLGTIAVASIWYGYMRGTWNSH